jgi:hypothetical protein
MAGGFQNGTSSSPYERAANSSTTNSSSSTVISSSVQRAVVGRRMLDTTGELVVLQSEDTLDYFRQGAQRQTCAAAVRDWPEKELPFELDVQAYYDMVSKHDIVDILAEAARLLSE